MAKNTKKRHVNPLQRPAHFVRDLRSKAWWSSEEFPFVTKLESNFDTIAREYNRVVASGRMKLHPQAANGPRKPIVNGAWAIHELWSMGWLNHGNAFDAPGTVRILEALDEIVTHPRGLVYFSILPPHSHVIPHCGPTNTRIRGHLAITAPEGAAIRVGEEQRRWEVGKCLIFDDSWEHEVWNTSDQWRAVLLFDMWHPDLNPEQRRHLLSQRKTLEAMAHRRRSGWYPASQAVG